MKLNFYSQNIFVFVFLILMMPINSQAQVLQPGDALISCDPPYSTLLPQSTLAVKRIQDVGTLYQDPTNLGKDQSANVPVGMMWFKSDFGGEEIFSTTIDQTTGTIYAASTSLYLSINTSAAAKVFEIDAMTGAVSTLVTLPGDRGIGFIDIDEQRGQLFAVNMNDGIIYRIDIDAGTVSSSYDPFTADDGATGLAPIGERLFGLAYNAKEDRVYYSVWNADADNTNAVNTVRSIGLLASGDFDTTDDVLEITTPRLPSQSYNMPIGDIEFNRDFTSVLIAESSFDSFSSSAHKARVFKYDGSTGSWSADNNMPTGNDNKYDIGDVNGHKNARGGVAWAYETVDLVSGSVNNILEKDEEYILLTGDALINDPNIEIYGLQYTSIDGGDSYGSILVDVDANVNNDDKAVYADVDIFKGNKASFGSIVWLDEDEDGVYTASETPVVGVTVNAYVQSAPGVYTLVGTTTTDAEGEYYFEDSNITGGIDQDETYYIVIEDPSFVDEKLSYSGTDYELTIANVGTGFRPDNNDSDGTIAPASFPFDGYPYIEYTSSDFRTPFDHSHFFGFKAATVLPVVLSSFEAKTQGCNIALSWVSKSELNFDFYEVQRSVDGQYFEVISTVKSAGLDDGNAYMYLDQDAQSTNYYRLKMVDVDLTFEYSDVVVAKTNCNNSENQVELYPNPIMDNATSVNIRLYVDDIDNTSIHITDMAGRPIRQIKHNFNEGWNIIPMTVNDLTAGTYYIVTSTFDVKNAIRLVKLRD